MAAKNQLAWIWNEITSLSPYVYACKCPEITFPHNTIGAYAFVKWINKVLKTQK